MNWSDDLDVQCYNPEHSKSKLGVLITKLLNLLKKPSVEADLIGVLQALQNSLNESQLYLANGILNINFAEAAIFLQNATHLYDKKVDMLWSFMIDCQMRLHKIDLTPVKTAEETKSIEQERKKLEERINRNKRRKIKLKQGSLEEEDLGLLNYSAVLQEIEKKTNGEKIVPSSSKSDFKKIEPKQFQICTETSFPRTSFDDLVCNNDKNGEEHHLGCYSDLLINSNCFKIDENLEEYLNRMWRKEGLKTVQPIDFGSEKWNNDVEDDEDYFDIEAAIRDDALLDQYLLKKSLSYTKYCENAQYVRDFVTYSENRFCQRHLESITSASVYLTKFPENILKDFQKGLIGYKEFITRLHEVNYFKKARVPENFRDKLKSFMNQDDVNVEKQQDAQFDIISTKENQSSNPSVLNKNPVTCSDTDSLYRDESRDDEFLGTPPLTQRSEGESGIYLSESEKTRLSESRDSTDLEISRSRLSNEPGSLEGTLLDRRKSGESGISGCDESGIDLLDTSRETLRSKRRCSSSTEVDSIMENECKTKCKKIRLAKLQTVDYIKFEHFYHENYDAEDAEREDDRVSLPPIPTLPPDGVTKRVPTPLNLLPEDSLRFSTEDLGEEIDRTSDMDFSPELASILEECVPLALSSDSYDVAGEAPFANCSGLQSDVICEASTSPQIMEQENRPSISELEVGEDVESMGENGIILPEIATSDSPFLEWKNYIEPIIKQAVDKSEFDIHQYGTVIMDSIPKDQPLKFESLVENKSASEVSRYFLASLQLANTCNVDLVHEGFGIANKSLELTLLSRERYHEQLKNYEAPSEGTFRDRLGKLQALHPEILCATPRSKKSRPFKVKSSSTRKRFRPEATPL